MAPKQAQKPKAAEPSIPKSKPKATTNTPATPRKAKAPVVYTSIEHDAETPMPIEVNFEGQSAQAKALKGGNYGQHLKLQAGSSFTIVKTILFTEGEYEGMQAVLLRPAKQFAFMKLPREVRNEIYAYYTAPKGVVNSDIVIEGKRNSNRELYAKYYSEGSKDRLALLAVCKEVYEEAVPILYAQTIKLESTTTLVDFLTQISSSARNRITKVRVKTYVKTTSRNAMNLLAEAQGITSLHFDLGVFAEGDPVKAARAFDNDTHKFLEAAGSRKGDKAGGVDVLSFGKRAFMYKDDKKTAQEWPDEMLDEFKKSLKGKLK